MCLSGSLVSSGWLRQLPLIFVARFVRLLNTFNQYIVNRAKALYIKVHGYAMSRL